MNCKCGVPAFTFEKIADGKKHRINKCGIFILDSKRKTRCNLNVITFIKDVIYITEKSKENIKIESEKIDAEIYYKEKLSQYIYLYEITQHLAAHFKKNYISNINYLLYRLNFPLFFEENENISNLKNRIIGCKKRPAIIPEKVLNLLSYPIELSVASVGDKIKKKNQKINVKPRLKINIDYLASIENMTELQKEDKKEIEKVIQEEPDSDSDSDDSKDKMFDMDNFDSCDECDDYDGGDISD
jgi:hypothetical protein